MIIQTSALTRVDLAGGTIDIWPLYLFHPGAATVNFAIDLLAKCRIETRNDERIILRSLDRGASFETTVAAIPQLLDEPRLEMLAKLVHFFHPEQGFELTTDCKAPAGAGLGGSSALAIAVIGALNRLVGDRFPLHKFVSIAANIESTVIRVPAGFQDYYPALHGGALAIHFRPQGIEVEPIDLDMDMLERRLAICYTGEPRNSGTNNWEITKRHIDGDRELFHLFDEIRDGALALRQALVSQDWPLVSRTLALGHPVRKRLAPNITTPHMDALVEKALANGAEAAKVCGAGGGGCIAFFCSDGRREDVERALAAEPDVQILDWHVARQGLIIDQA